MRDCSQPRQPPYTGFVGLNLERGGAEPLGTDGERRSARPARQWAVVRERPERLAEGILACPACELPIALAATLAVSAPLDCPYCGRHAPAREFLRLGAGAPPASRVAVVASFEG
jgi:hypothetical protein